MTRRYVILGNGIAGQTCAEDLRKADAEASIVIVALEENLGEAVAGGGVVGLAAGLEELDLSGASELEPILAQIRRLRIELAESSTSNHWWGPSSARPSSWPRTPPSSECAA